MFVVVTTFYTLDDMKSILLPKFVFFRSRLRLSLKNTNLLFYCFIFFCVAVALRIITCPPPFTQGRLFANPIITQIGRENNISAGFCRDDHWSPAFCGWLRAINGRPYGKLPYEKEPKGFFFCSEREKVIFSP